MKYISLILLFLLIQINTAAEEWQVKKDENNLVKFISSTPLLDFEGITNNIDGFMYWEGSNLFGAKNKVYFEVDLNTVKTGIGKRDRDMREDVLETDKWPKSYFTGSIIEYQQIDSTTYNVIAQGSLFIHGVEKQMKIPAKIILNDGTLKVISKFSIYLKDFNIEAPSLMAFIKVAEEIKLELSFFLQNIDLRQN